MITKQKLIIGLGNPSAHLQSTYHNVGTMAVRYIAEALQKKGIPLSFKPHRKLFTYAVMDDVALVIPLTFMNESGKAVREAMKKFGAKKEDLIVIHDESDIPLGTYKMSSGKNAAGHRGVESIMTMLGGSNEFLRARIGIRDANEQKRQKALTFVLKKISPKDEKILSNVFGDISAEIVGLR